MSEVVVEYGQNIANALLTQANSLKICTKLDFELAGELAISLARLKKQKNDNWKPMYDNAMASARQIKANWNKELMPIEQADSLISRARADWKLEQDRLARLEQERLEKEAKEKADKERQKLIEKAAEIEKSNPKKAEALIEKAEMVCEKPVFAEKVVEKTVRLESGGSITWIKDIVVEVIDIKALCAAVAAGYVSENCIEYKNLKAWAKLNGWKDGFDKYGLMVKEIQRESKRV